MRFTDSLLRLIGLKKEARSESSSPDGSKSGSTEGKGSSSIQRKARSPFDPRTYRRVLVTESGSISAKVMGITLNVLDMSYTGISVEQTEQSRAAVDSLKAASSRGELVDLELDTHSSEPALLRVRFVRSTNEILAFEFSDLSPELRYQLDLILDVKLIGLNMARVSPNHFEPEDSQTEWFSGPRDTHLLIWWQPDSGLSRFVFQLGQQALECKIEGDDLQNKGPHFSAVGESVYELAYQVIDQLAARMRRENAAGASSIEACREVLSASQPTQKPRLTSHV